METEEKIELSAKQKNDISAKKIVQEIISRGVVKVINSHFHWFNGFYYGEVNERQFEINIYNWIAAQYPGKQSRRLARDCMYWLEAQRFIDEKSAEDNGFLCFYNGIINIYNGQISNQIGFSDGGYPITYRILAEVPQLQFRYMTPYMDAFLHTVAGGDTTLILRIWEMIGYLLVPDTKGKAFFVLQGVPDSGKSVIGKLISSFFEDNKVRHLDIEQLGKRNATSALMNVCLNLSMDLPNKVLSSLAIRNLKQMTGNDDIEVEYRPGVYAKYYGRCKFLFATNHPIKLKGLDKGFTSRIVCIPFRKAIPKQSQDLYLLDKLLAEKDGIAERAMRAYRALAARNYIFTGSGDKYNPKISYLPGDGESRDAVVCEFVEANCTFCEPREKEKGVYTETLYTAYREFCEQNYYIPISSAQGFAQSIMRNYGDRIVRSRWREGNENRNGFKGILLIPMDFSDDYDCND